MPQQMERRLLCPSEAKGASSRAALRKLTCALWQPAMQNLGNQRRLVAPEAATSVEVAVATVGHAGSAARKSALVVAVVAVGAVWLGAAAERVAA
jgi:hypothetical protein